MSKMISCKACGKEIYKNAKSCPNCGKKNKGHSFIKFIFKSALLLCVLLLAYTKFINNQEDNKSNKKDTNTTVYSSTQPEQVASKASSEEKDILPESTLEESTTTDVEVQLDNAIIETTENNVDFRTWVDSYETFMNQYMDFMETYDTSNTAALIEYTELLNTYSDFLAKTEALNEDDYSVEDWAYYLAALTRINTRMSTLSLQ